MEPSNELVLPEQYDNNRICDSETGEIQPEWLAWGNQYLRNNTNKMIYIETTQSNQKNQYIVFQNNIQIPADTVYTREFKSEYPISGVFVDDINNTYNKTELRSSAKVDNLGGYNCTLTIEAPPGRNVQAWILVAQNRNGRQLNETEMKSMDNKQFNLSDLLRFERGVIKKGPMLGILQYIQRNQNNELHVETLGFHAGQSVINASSVNLEQGEKFHKTIEAPNNHIISGVIVYDIRNEYQVNDPRMRVEGVQMGSSSTDIKISSPSDKPLKFFLIVISEEMGTQSKVYQKKSDKALYIILPAIIIGSICWLAKLRS